jgi:hypothetical protein
VVLRYTSGEEILKGDRILFHGNSARVQFVATDPDDPSHSWYVREFGGGVMIDDPAVSGTTFIPADHLDHYEDLEFVSRSASG